MEENELKYLQRLTEDALEWKLVETNQHWAGNWTKDGKEYFLLVVRYHEGDKSHYIYASGTDDFMLTRRDIPLELGKKLFHKISDGYTIRDLKSLGFQSE